MSSILKALKKLEVEKTARKPESLNIDAEILRGDGSRRLSLPGICLVATIVFVCGGGAMYVYMKPGAGTIAGQQVTTSVPPSGGRPALSPSLPAAPVSTPERVNTGRSEKPALPPQAIEISAKRAPDRVTPSPAVSPGSPAKPRPVQPVIPSRTKQIVAVPSAQAVLPAVQPAVPSLRVNGIAFQDGQDSVAVVNGVSVSNGSVIEGARVELIQKDLVRFSYGGDKFEVELGKSNR